MKTKENHRYYNHQFKHTAVPITNHPGIQTIDLAEALNIHPIMLYRCRGEMRTGKIKDNDREAGLPCRMPLIYGRQGNGCNLAKPRKLPSPPHNKRMQSD